MELRIKIGDLVRHRDANYSATCDVGLIVGVSSPQRNMTFVHVHWSRKNKVIKGYMPWELSVVDESR